VLAVLPLIGGLLVFLGGHESKAEFAAVARAKYPNSGEVPESETIGVIPACAKREPQVRNCAPGSLEIPRCAIAHLGSGPADHPGMTA
jgi:hypothetical protein